MFGSASGPTKLVAIGLIALMAVGSILLWLGIPLGWVYLASRMAKTSQPTLGPYMVVLVGIPVSMVIVGRFLSRLNRLYGEVTRTTPEVHAQLPWLRSMRGERDTEAGSPRTVLDVVMVVSVGLAMLCFGIWFFFFAGSSLPT